MQFVKQKLFSLHKFSFWFKYIDDTFIIILLHLSNLLSLVDSIDFCIQFTFEIDENHYFPFVSVLASKLPDRFVLLFQENLYLSHYALLIDPPQQKITSFYTFVFIVLRIYLNPSALKNEIKYLKSLTVAQAYKLSLIYKALNKFNSTKRSFSDSDNPPNFNFIILPFLQLFYFLHALL